MNEDDFVMQWLLSLDLVSFSEDPKAVLQVHLTQPVLQEMIETHRLPIPDQATYNARLRSFFTPATYNAFMQSRQLPAADKEGIFLECLVYPTSAPMLILSKPDRFFLHFDWKLLIDMLHIRENAVLSMWHCLYPDHQVWDAQSFLFRVDDYVLEGEPLPRIPDEQFMHVGEN